MVNRNIWPNGAAAALTITFDDGYLDTCNETSAWLAALGLGATYYVISRRVGTPFENIPTATWEHWRQAALLGHEIGSHSATHAPMAGALSDFRRIFLGILTAPDRRAYVRQTLLRIHALKNYPPEPDENQDRIDPLWEPRVSRQEIRQHLPECPVQSFSYPAGRINRTAYQAVAEAGYQSARGNQAGINRGFNSPFSLRSICMGPGLTLQTLEPWFHRVIEPGGWLIITFHLVSAGNFTQYPYFCSVADFRKICNRIMELPLWVATQEDVVNHLEMDAIQ